MSGENHILRSIYNEAGHTQAGLTDRDLLLKGVTDISPEPTFGESIALYRQKGDSDPNTLDDLIETMDDSIATIEGILAVNQIEFEPMTFEGWIAQIDSDINQIESILDAAKQENPINQEP